MLILFPLTPFYGEVLFLIKAFDLCKADISAFDVVPVV